MFVVNVVSEARGVNNGERNPNTILLKLWKVHQIIVVEGLLQWFEELTDVSRLYFDTRFNMSLIRTFDDLVRKDIRLTQRIHKGCASCPRGAFGDGVNIIINS